MMKQCTTHHHACDCREREFEKIREQRDELLAACELAITCGTFTGAVEEKVSMKLYEAIKKARGE